MDIKIGVENTTREITLESDRTADDVRLDLIKALLDNGLFEIEDTKGRRVLVPAAKIAYVDLGSEKAARVGFGI